MGVFDEAISERQAPAGGDVFSQAVSERQAAPAAPSTWDKVKAFGAGALNVVDRISHFGQPKVAKDLVQKIAASPAYAPETSQQLGHEPGLMEPVGGQAMTGPSVPPWVDARPVAAGAVDMATSPMSYLGLLSKIPAVTAFLSRGGQIEKSVTALESGLTGKSMEALSQASTGPGRKALQQAAGNQGQVARSLEGVASNSKAFMPEESTVNAILQKAPDIDIRPTLKAFDEAMPKLTGEMGAATPGQLALRNKLQAYKSALQGKLPDEGTIAEMDFGGNLADARAAIADPQSKWGVLSDLARKAAAEAERATGKASAAAGRVQETANAYETAPTKVMRYEGFPQQGYTQNSDLPGLLQANRLAEGVAKEANANAIAKAATGEITAQDAAAAKSALDRATRSVQVADAANEFSQGRTLDQVSRALVDRHNLAGSDLQDVLNKGRNFVANNSFTPAEINPKISAVDFKRLREALDRDIDFNDPTAQSLKGALRIPRTQMKNDLIAAAGPEYAGQMKQWAEKIDDFNELNSRLGKAPSLRLNRAENLLKTAPKEGNADLLSRIDTHTGQNFSEQSRLARLADEFTEKARGGNVLNPQKAGLPSWRPRGGMPFASMEAGGIGTALHSLGLPPPLIAAIDAAAVASTTPAFAAKVAIPAARHLPPALLKALNAVPASILVSRGLSDHPALQSAQGAQ